MRYTQEKVETLAINEDSNLLLELLLRKFDNGRRIYYYRTFIQKPELANKQTSIVGSLKTDNYEKAKQLAYTKHAEIQLRQKQGFNVKPLTVAEGIDKFILHYQDNISREMNGYSNNILRNLKKSVDLYWKEYVGHKDLDSINYTDFENYEAFRRDYAKSTKRIKNKYKQKYKDTVAISTLKGEINYFRQFLRWCATHGYYQGSSFEWRYKPGTSVRNRREAFSLEQYRKLVRYMRSKTYLNKGKNVALGGSPDGRVVRHRQMLRCYILFLCNTGLRVGEARNLRWRDVSFVENRNGDKVCVVEIDQLYSKVKTSSTRSAKVVGRVTAWKALQRYRDYLVSTGTEIGKDHFIFSNSKGEVVRDFREGFAQIVKEAGVEKDRFGRKFVPYSCRHTYITFRLKYGKNLSIHSLAKNCRTSVQMIQQNYDDTDTLDFVDELTL